MASFVALFFSVIIQTSLLPVFFPVGSVPDVVLILIMFWTIRSGFEKNLARTVMGGFLLDIFSFWPAGINIFSFVTVSFLVAWIGKRFLTSQLMWRFFLMLIVIFFGGLINSIITFVLWNARAGFGGVSFGSLSLYPNLFWKSLFDAVLFMLVYWSLDRWDRRSGQNRRILIAR